MASVEWLGVLYELLSSVLTQAGWTASWTNYAPSQPSNIPVLA